MRRQPDQRVATWLDAQAVETLYLSTISLSELLLGIESRPVGRRRKALAEALGAQILGLFGRRVLPFDVAAAEAYPQVVISARRQGHAVSVADGQVAAIAASRGFSVATRDETPFRMAGVAVINPWDI